MVKNIKEVWQKFWYLLWKDDSLKGWIFSLLFIFIFIKFIFFPTLNLITGTSLPLAIVESCSMYHQKNLLSNFNNWWQEHESQYLEIGINKEKFQKFIFKKGFNKGDILFVVGTKPSKLKIGDVIIFNTQTTLHPVIHRIIKISGPDGNRVFTTMGDNVGRVQFFEEEISETQVVGRAVLKLAPYLGWGKLIFYDWRKPETERGFC